VSWARERGRDPRNRGREPWGLTVTAPTRALHLNGAAILVSRGITSVGTSPAGAQGSFGVRAVGIN